MESKKMKEREPRIKVRFSVIGEEYSKEYLSEKLNLEPSRFRTKDDWPEAIRNWPVYNPDILDKYKPKTVWEISTYLFRGLHKNKRKFSRSSSL